MVENVLIVSVALFCVAIGMLLYCIIRGPTLVDRVLVMDVVGINLISTIAVISVLFQTKAFLEVILILGILAFISTIALAKFIERGVIIERKRDS